MNNEILKPYHNLWKLIDSHISSFTADDIPPIQQQEETVKNNDTAQPGISLL